MTLEALLLQLLPALEQAGMPYMLTGSVASSAYGVPRSTLDIDIVIQPSREQLVALIKHFPSAAYYADEQQALQALAKRSQFNVIDHATGWKVDFIIAEDSEYGRTALDRRQVIEMAGKQIRVASAEDVVIAKLRWAKLSGSQRQLLDAVGIINTQGSALDMVYIDRWVTRLALDEQWRQAQNRP